MALDTDAYNVQIDRVLLPEKPDDTIEPIGYWSRSQTDAEKRHKFNTNASRSYGPFYS